MESKIVAVAADLVTQPLDCIALCGEAGDQLDCELVEERAELLATTGSSGGSGSEGSSGTTVGATEGGSSSGDDATTTGSGPSVETVEIHCTYTSSCIGGRASAAWAERPIASYQDASVRWLAQAAHDEAGSVASFRLLARELAAHGAPARLRAEIERAADDEARHACAMLTLARAQGVEPMAVRLRDVPVRSLEQIAIENAEEGCARETFNALVAAHQAAHATWPPLRRAMAIIAEDERRHAELAWAIDAWLESRLDDAARARVATARARALQEICDTPRGAFTAKQRRRLGLPEAARARSLAEGLRDALAAVAVAASSLR